MNEIYSLSKQRFRNEITDKEFRLKRRQALEKTFGYRAHLVSADKGNEHSDAKTVVPSAGRNSSTILDKKIAKNQSADENSDTAKSGSNDNQKEPVLGTSERKTPTIPASQKDVLGASAKTPESNTATIPNQAASADPERSPQRAYASDSPTEAETTKTSQFKVLPIAVMITVVIGAVGVYFSLSSDDLQSDQDQRMANETSGQRVNLAQQFTQLVENQNYSDEAIALFLNFWPLAEQSQKDEFLGELDEKILELDPEISDRLAYIQALISRSENDLVKQTKAILNGAQGNSAFSQLTTQWNKATSSQKNVFIDYISSTYQEFIVDFDNEQNLLVVEAILDQLDITSSVRSVDLPATTYAKSVSEESLSNTPVTTLASDSMLALNAETAVDDSLQNIEAKVDKAVAEVASPIVELVKKQPSSANNAAQVVNKQVEPTQSIAPVVAPIVKPVTQAIAANAGSIEAVTTSINALLAKDSLRNPKDSKELAELTRFLFTEIKNAYGADGKAAAKADTFAVFEQHPRFPYHYYDIELFFTDKNTKKIQPDMKTDDAMKKLTKLFKNAKKPSRPTDA